MTYKTNDAMETAVSETCQQTAQLMAAIEKNNVPAANKTLQNPKINVNATCGAVRVTALQLAASWGNDGLELVKLLLSHGAQVNVTDKLGRTPLHHAAAVGGDEVVKVLLAAGAKPDTRFQVGTRQQEQTVLNTVTECLDVHVGAKLAVPECWGRTPLHQAVKGNHSECVELLLDAGASVNAQDECGLTPLLLAGAGVSPDDRDAMENYEMVIKLLVAAKADVSHCNPDTGIAPLQHASMLCSTSATATLLDAGAPLCIVPGMESTPLHEAAGSGCLDVVQLLLDRGASKFVNVPDQVGRTPLHKAAYSGARDVLTLLLSHGGDLSSVTKTNVSVVDAIVASIPRPVHFLTDVMDYCVMTNNASVNDRNFKIHLDFGPLSPEGNMQQMAVVSALMNGCKTEQHGRLFQHPLLQIFIRIKWRNLRLFFLVLMALQLSFVFTLSAYVVVLVHSDLDETELHSPRRILFFTSAALLLYALGQLLLFPRHYIYESETWLNMVSTSLAAAVSIMGEMGPIRHPRTNTTETTLTTASSADACGTGEILYTFIISRSVLHMISVAVLLAWAELMLLLSRFPIWGYYALMFQAVLLNVLKVLLAFVCLVVGFALSFTVQFHTKPGFEDPWRALVKTTVMMMGEFEYGELLDMQTESRLPVTSRLVFLVFVILAPIVLMNLMVGLAVSDIQALQNEGHIRRLLKQADFVTHLETLSSHKLLQWRCLPRKLLHLVNARRCIATKLVVQPTTTHHQLSTRLLEELIAVALRSQEQLRNREKHSDAESIDDISFDDSNISAGGATNVSILEALHNLQSQMADVRRLLKMDRTIVARSFQPPGRRPSSTQNAHMRFSEAISGIRNTNVILRNLRHSTKHTDT